MIDILLSTYNGERFLEEQLHSIFLQTFKDWKIIIRDDGSSDITLEIIKKWKNLYPKKIIFLNDVEQRLGASKSFSKLLEFSDSPYAMLCDQDDFWKSNKIEVSFEALKSAEDKYGYEMPLMVCSDLEVVDENLNILSKSFWKDRKDTPDILNDFEKLIAHSVVTGNTIMMNKSAVLISTPIKTNFFLHDQWISIKVAKFGQIIFIKDCLIKYRQHNNNVLGSFKLNKTYLVKKIKYVPYYIQSWQKLKKELGINFSLTRVLYFKIKYNLKKII